MAVDPEKPHAVIQNAQAGSTLRQVKVLIVDEIEISANTLLGVRADSITDGFKAKIDDGLTLKITDALRAI